MTLEEYLTDYASPEDKSAWGGNLFECGQHERTIMESARKCIRESEGNLKRFPAFKFISGTE